MAFLEEFPEEVLRVLFAHLSSFQDIVSLEETHPKIKAKSEYAFWRRVHTLALGTDTKEERGPLIIANGDQRITLPNELDEILDVIDRTTSIREVVIGPESSLAPHAYQKLLSSLAHSSLKLRCVEVCYENPENVLASKELKDKAAFPSRHLHMKITKLIHAQAESLDSVVMRMPNEGHILIERSPDGSAVNVEYSSDCSMDARPVIHPILSSFSYKQRKWPSSLTLSLRCPAETILPVLDFCISASIPSQLRPHLTRVNVQLSTRSGPDVVGYWDNLPQYSSLNTVQWNFVDEDKEMDASQFAEMCDNVTGKFPRLKKPHFVHCAAPLDK